MSQLPSLDGVLPGITTLPREHGGSDTKGVPRYDFSTNSNASGPCPAALAAVCLADTTRYPDPSYAALRLQIAHFHGVTSSRILLAASASEFIFRLTAWVAQQQGSHLRQRASVCVPPHAFGDYTQAARAWGLEVTHADTLACLVWCCEPSSPLGGPQDAWPEVLESSLLGTDEACEFTPTGAQKTAAIVVLDCAYEPLRLSGTPSLTPAQRHHLWQLFSPNKSLGLTGVRAAYAIAPVGAQETVRALDALAPSWPLGAHGVALLQAWSQPEVQAWLAESLHTLRRWKATQIDMLISLGWTCLPSDANFFCARPVWHPSGLTDTAEHWAPGLSRLRAAGIKLRDTKSFGLPRHLRLGVQTPEAQDALRVVLQSFER